MSSIGNAAANDSLQVSDAVILRRQLQTIADQVMDKIKADVAGSVSIAVEGENPRTLAENAFVDAAQERGLRSTIGNSMPNEAILSVYILQAAARIHELNSKQSERIVDVSLEARLSTAEDREMKLIGTFSESSKDTVPAEFGKPALPTHQAEEGSTLQKILTPLIVIGSTVIIVYLFFTVRS